MSDNQAIIYQFHNTSDGKKIVQATLNSEKSLNALNQEMIESLLEKLPLWQDDDNIIAILLDSAGDRAFCAGGDIVQLYRAMSDAPDSKQPYVEEFFTKEYRLDHLIHTYAKPIIVWGNGFVMGGGLGLMAGASHRIVTETSKVAMPEITIGLYPDVGATYFLNKMPDNLGLFLGLTAAQMNASDCLEVKLADHFLLHQQKNSLINALTTSNYANNDLHQQVSNIINGLAQESSDSLPRGNISNHRAALQSVLSSNNLTDVITAIGDIE
ncbi:MAG: enoyl-CoA hydratase/isomerase family protein, partial [Psychrobium sp.]|nr:enoyl-CoA hydratase/isomerase family protein [Psychrobium sp.]